MYRGAYKNQLDFKNNLQGTQGDLFGSCELDENKQRSKWEIKR